MNQWKRVWVAGERCPVRLVAQIHDELLFEVNTEICDVYVITGEQSQPYEFDLTALMNCASNVNWFVTP